MTKEKLKEAAAACFMANETADELLQTTDGQCFHLEDEQIAASHQRSLKVQNGEVFTVKRKEHQKEMDALETTLEKQEKDREARTDRLAKQGRKDAIAARLQRDEPEEEPAKEKKAGGKTDEAEAAKGKKTADKK